MEKKQNQGKTCGEPKCTSGESMLANMIYSHGNIPYRLEEMLETKGRRNGN